MKSFTLFILLTAAVYASAQTPPSHPALDLCRKGKYTEAILGLEIASKDKLYKNEPEVWQCLSLAYLQKADFKNAKKAAEKTVKLAPNNSTYQTNLAFIYVNLRQYGKARGAAEKALQIDPKNYDAVFMHGTSNLWENKYEAAGADADQMIAMQDTYPQGYAMKANVLMAKVGERLARGSTLTTEVSTLKQAYELLKIGIEKCKAHPNLDLVTEEFASVSAVYEYVSRDKSKFDENDPNITPLKILSKPRPGYTDSARQSNVQGTVVLAVLFRDDGKVGIVLLIKGLDKGLSQQAISAAKRIQFQPMMKDGKPVSVVRMVEYSFSIY